MKKYEVVVVEDDDKVFTTKAWVYGEVASGEKVWEFDGMEENAIYTATRMKIAGKMRYVLFRQ